MSSLIREQPEKWALGPHTTQTWGVTMTPQTTSEGLSVVSSAGVSWGVDPPEASSLLRAPWEEQAAPQHQTGFLSQEPRRQGRGTESFPPARTRFSSHTNSRRASGQGTLWDDARKKGQVLSSLLGLSVPHLSNHSNKETCQETH